MNKSFLDRLAVCSWSLQPAHPQNLLQQTQQIGIPRLQCALDPLREHPAAWGQFPELYAAAGITLVSGMFGTIGEDYSTLETIRQTGGVVPDATWAENWKNIQATASLAEQIGLKLITFHAGFLPHEETDPAFQKLFDRISRIADLFASKNIALGFETGQETAETLRAFLEKLNRPTVGVNFDPANMILYDKGDPIAALRTLGPWLKQCHIKDALKTKQPGTWGEEVVVGTGDVDWHAFLKTLEDLNFSGFCCMEREAGCQRVADIRSARDFIETILACG
ncbi:MAG: sugar phosphate isomerase/epimerase family protein [Verrucomicrobiota bacterium]